MEPSSLHRIPNQLELFNYLYGYVSEHKKQLFEQKLAHRTNHVTVALENIHYPQNASAVLRTSECLGVQQIHYFLEKYGNYEVNPKVVKGSKKWLNVHQHKSTQIGIENLKQQGYKIVATAPHATKSIEDLELADKTAFLFGEEADGLTEQAVSLADELVTIPMFGFTESFNLSVSAGICLHSFLSRLRKSDIEWQLSEAEKQQLRLEWSYQSVRNAPSLVRYFMKS